MYVGSRKVKLIGMKDRLMVIDGREDNGGNRCWLKDTEM